eukprot:CAMPEP_0184557370 /NCGR_PEP_ID=MMETSP0199_2-20130426/42573_1 /TAXON_ID=1112570 /ORGANISM="Thraustochytrium sp., Strain LLF1b" /LENGTH=40 /DNA_ID= /DNA_START= /DNA_END= /DNA_ORIENTATION=
MDAGLGEEDNNTARSSLLKSIPKNSKVTNMDPSKAAKTCE